MLETLDMRNFQPHVKQVFHFDPFCTTFIGNSDAGKSATLRALLWLLTNNFRGDDFISWGKKFAKVSLTVDGHIITRRKGKRNLYFLDGKELEAFGMKVPDEIANLLNIGPDNIQSQLDGPFWFADKPLQVSRNLNKIVNLEVIDMSLTNIAKDVRMSQASVTVCQERLTEVSKEYEKMLWVPKANKGLIALEQQNTEVEKIRAEIDSLTSSIKNVTRLKKEIRIVTRARKRMSKIQAIAKQCVDIETEIELLERSINEVKNLRSIIKQQKAIDDFGKIEDIAEQICELQVDVKCLEQSVNFIDEKEKEICHAKRQFGKIEAKLHKIMKGRCPFCNRKLTSPTKAKLSA